MKEPARGEDSDFHSPSMNARLLPIWGVWKLTDELHNPNMRSSVLGVLAASVIVLSGCSAQAPNAPASIRQVAVDKFTVHGTITTPSIFGGAKAAQDGESCAAREGFDDVATGAQVVLSNAAGDTIAIARLQSGVAKFKPLNGSAVYGLPTCVFAFELDAVPSGENFYGVHVGNVNRGVVQFSKADLQAGPALTLG